MVLRDKAAATDLRRIILRYFNPIGSDPDLESGVYVREPSHVLGQLAMAAQGLKVSFTITGTEHPTRDGTGIRDYVLVWDLAQAHVAAVEKLDAVLDQVAAPSTVTRRHRTGCDGPRVGGDLPEGVREARPGHGGSTAARDAVGAFANVDKVHDVLGWTSSLNTEQAISSGLAWFKKRREILGYD